MADGNLTWQEFWKLTPKERLARCSELSEHDAFMVRLTDPGIPVRPQEVPCNECAHRVAGKPACKAFPEGLDGDHIRALMEDPSIACGNEYHFEKKS